MPNSAQLAGFDAELFHTLARLEPASFWFNARNRVIVWALRTYFPHAESLLEVGCGTGYVLQAIARAFPGLRLSAVDLYEESLAFASARVPHASVGQADARSLPFKNEFDVVGAFDVLEHIDDDRAALGSLREAVRPGGGVILTVPQHPWLWSDFDRASHHVRRYRRGELEAEAGAAGLEILHSTSFISLLLPVLAASRLGRRRRRDDSVARDLNHSSRVEAVLGAVTRAEFSAVSRGVKFPVGGSRLLVARRG